MSTKTPGQTLYENAEPIFAWDELDTQAKERHEKMAQAVLTAHAPKLTAEVNGSAHNITKIYTMENSNAQLDSPETDAHRPFSGTKIELLVEKDFARQLELQRDAFSDALVVVMAERDTARAELSQERLVVQGALASESRAVNHANELMVELAKVKGELEEEEQKKEAAHRVIRIHDFGVNEDLKSQLEASQKEVKQLRENCEELSKSYDMVHESKEKELAKVKGELEGVSNRKKWAEEMWAEDRAKRDTLKSQLEASQKEVEKLTKELRNIEDVAESKELRIGILCGELTQLRQSQAGGRLTPRVLKFGELIQEGDFYVSGSGGLCKVDAQHFGNRANNWPVAFIRFVSPWHIIDPANPATLPTKEDVDRNGNVLFLWQHLNQAGIYDWIVDWDENDKPTHWTHTNLPPVPPVQDAWPDTWRKIRMSFSLPIEDVKGEAIAKEAFLAGQAQGGKVK